MLGKRSRVSEAKCLHADVITVASAGIERDVCEACGKVSFRFLTDATPEVEIQRVMFAREVDRKPHLVGAA